MQISLLIFLLATSIQPAADAESLGPKPLASGRISGPYAALQLHLAQQAPRQLRPPAVKQLRQAKPQKLAAVQRSLPLVKKGMQALHARARQLKEKVAATSAGRAFLRTKHKLDRRLKLVRARMTLAADHLELRLPSRLGRLYGKVRRTNLASLPFFATHMYARDPAFFASYGIFSFYLDNVIIPGALISMGYGAPVLAAVRLVTNKPLDLLAVTLRTHFKREDRSLSFWGSLKHLGHEFKDFGDQRRAENRALAKELGLH